MTIKEKILTFLDSKGIKKAEFFESIGIAPSNFKGAAKQTELGGDKIVRILTAFPDLSADWLLRDEGDMLRKTTTPQHTDSIVTHDISAPPQATEPLIDKFLNTIQVQSEEIGRLKARIEELERVPRVHPSPITEAEVAYSPPVLQDR